MHAAELYAWLLDEPHRSTAHGMMAALAADTQSVTDVMARRGCALLRL